MTPTFHLRPAVEADTRAIRTLVQQARINPTGLNWPNFIVATPSSAFGTPSEDIIACGQIKPHADGSRELASIAVAPSWRGQGIARAIIEQLMATHPGNLYLMCLSSLGPFYAQFGFHTLSEDDMPAYFRRIKRLTKIADFVMAEGELLLVMGRRAP